MKLSRNAFVPLAMVATLSLCSGCGGGSNLPPGETGTVSGKVTYKGGPVPEGCAVIFIRDEDGLIGTGTVDSSGDYVIRMRNGLKVVTGVYRVVVTPPNPAANLDQDEIMRLGQEGKLPDPATVKEVPMKFRSPEETKLIFDVQPGANTFDIDMKD